MWALNLQIFFKPHNPFSLNEEVFLLLACLPWYTIFQSLLESNIK
jgi:hypothetical protein